jgi:peptide chain release factor
MEEQLIQVSAGRGPEECSRVVAKVVECILREARSNKIEATMADCVKGHLKDTLVSAVIIIRGKHAAQLAEKWQGTVQWIAQSPYRKFHRRKNWFVSVQLFDAAQKAVFNEKDVSYKTCRASGPGGQHVNKTETAVRATHDPSGISVVASNERSQLQNKKEALERLRCKVLAWQMEKNVDAAKDQWLQHTNLKRGDAGMVIQEAL